MTSELIERSDIVVGGCRIAYARSGAPDARDVVIALHGFGTTGYRTFRHVAPQLSERGVTLIAPDLPGFGESDAPDVVYSLDFYADVIADFADALGIVRPVVLGHSMGGKVAAATAVRHAERFRALSLVNPGGFAPGERLLPFVASHPLFHRLLQADWFYYRVLPRTVLGPIFQTDENRQQMQRLREAHVHLDLKRTGYRERLASLTTPTLVLWGRDDRLLPLRTTKRIVRALPQTDLHLIPDAGHAPMKDQPERFSNALAGWLAKQRPEGSEADL